MATFRVETPGTPLGYTEIQVSEDNPLPVIVMGTGSSSVAAEDITDATEVGVALITAEDEAAGRTAIGAAAATHTHVGGDVVLTGYAVGAEAAVVDTDSVLEAIGKLEARIVELEALIVAP